MQRNQTVLGLILVGLGVLFLVARNTNLGGWIFLAGIGAIFLVAYVTTRNYGMLIPGCILLGLGAGEGLGNSGLGLGLGFIGIFVVDSVVRGRMSHWWPLIPGLVISLSEAGSLTIPGLGTLGSVVNDWWPLALVLIGVLILVQGARRR